MEVRCRVEPFKFIQIEGKDYPTVIMGEDHFTGWFSKCPKFSSEEERAKAYRETLETAYSLGVRAFSMSPHDTLILVLKKFKSKHPEIVCISNHHWKSHYYLGEKSMWNSEIINKLGPDAKENFSEEEIKSIRLDEKEYVEQLNEFKKFCDFCLVGNLGISALITLGREDIIEKEIELVRELGMVPLGMCEGGAFALEKMETLNVGGTWVMVNRHEIGYNTSEGLSVLKSAKKPVTAYRVFTSPEGFNLEKSIEFVNSVETIKSIVVGVSGKEQAQETFSKLKEFWS